MLLTNKFVCAVSVLIMPLSAYATNNNAMKVNWTNPSMSHCMTHNIGDVCVGNSLSGCKNWINSARSANRGTADDEMAILMLVARDVNENGARFCVTQLQGANKNKGKAWTVYYNPAGGNTYCTWLCKEGHSGEGCAAGVATTCDATTISKSDFKNYKIATTSVPSVEGEIYMFHWGEYKKCGVHKGQEHDMILAVSNWTPTGHGAFVRPMVFRAERSGWKDMVSTATLWGVGSETLLCKDGYRPNGDKTDCVAINATECAKSALCSGWDVNAFSESTHSMVARLGGGCYEYRCATPGMGFVSASERVCQECSGDRRVGVSSETGACVRCPLGRIFDDNANSSGNCVEAKQYSMTDLSYGPGKGMNAELTSQCWINVDSGTYSECVTGK